MNTVIQVVQLLKESIPVEWDRFTKDDDDYYVVYGWIARSDGHRDFLMISMYADDLVSNAWYTTSSAKYTREIAIVLQGNADNHNDCRKIEELFDLKS